MKAVLIATDFTEPANNAASYGVELAKSLNATAILFNASDHFPLVITKEQTAITPDELNTYILEKLAEDARLLTSIHHWPVFTSCKTGSLLKAFREAILESKAELVVMGMKKDRKGILRILGSTVTGLIGQLDTCLLVVPEETSFTYIFNIALAMSADISPDENTHAVGALRALTDRFHSKIYFVQVTRSRLPGNGHPSNFPYQLAWVKQKLNTEFERVTGKDIPTSLTKFVALNDIHMLVILAHKQSLFKRFLFRSNSRTLAFECPVPLMILPGKSTISDLTTDAEDHQL